MAKFCIKKDHPEVLALSKELNLPVSVIAAKSAVWMETNEVYDRFPTSSELNVKPQINYQTQTNSTDGIIASENTIRDLAARLSNRIGIPVVFESDRSKNYKGKVLDNKAYVNLAHATLDTPIHEILGHPIIRALKKQSISNKIENTSKELQEQGFPKYSVTFEDGYDSQSTEFFNSKEEATLFIKKTNTNLNNLYQNLLKELEYGKGKEVLDRIKRDYNIKKVVTRSSVNFKLDFPNEYTEFSNSKEMKILEKEGNYEEMAKLRDEWFKSLDKNIYYTLEEQQEEAIVELLGLMTAEKLDAVKDGKLISLLKRLIKEMKQFIRSLINQKEVNIDKLPDNMTLGDLSDLLAYSNSKLILPGYEVEYTTPDNMKFKTYQEASVHISKLFRQISDVDLDSIIRDFPKKLQRLKEVEEQIRDEGIMENSPLYKQLMKEVGATKLLLDFIEKNKEYEQSKEIIEEWKKVNNIQYNPEEIYSRGQEFVSVVGAYSSFDVNLMMQNLLSHIEDNEKAGGKFAISAFTKPVDKTIGHLEGGGGKIKFKLYPQSSDILWAANTDVYSGSVWDASEKVNKDKKSELLGVSYTKYPSLNQIGAVQPNLANIVDDLAHHHNELGIVLTGNNFRLEYDQDIPYSTKKIIDSINSILDQKYGKLVKPEINKKIKTNKISRVEDIPVNEFSYSTFDDIFYYRKESDGKWYGSYTKEEYDLGNRAKTPAQEQAVVDNYNLSIGNKVIGGIQPTQTTETLKESIDSVKRQNTSIKENEWVIEQVDQFELGVFTFMGKPIQLGFNTPEEAKKWLIENKPKEKEYTSQALINTKIAALKEVAKKYPRSLIRSEVRSYKSNSENQNLFDVDELPFQKIPSPNKVNYSFKASDVIVNNIDKIKSWEKQIKDPNILYKKIQELGASKQTMELLQSSEGNTVEEKLINFLANYSYTIEINTAKENHTDEGNDSTEHIQLNVPGGTNYKINVFKTPLIIPSIINHFFHKNQIGWFRSDDKVKVLKRTEQVDNIKNIPESFYFEQISPFDQSVTKVQVTKENDSWIFTVNNKDKYTKKPFEVINAYNTYFRSGYSNENTTDSKTRRILEVQSDLFQKGRDKKSLTKSLDDTTGYGGGPAQAQEYRESITSSDNQFLQLLNKDNNWVTFFVKSIIQDSAKKGYEKVLFPTGKTVEKIEGFNKITEELERINNIIEKHKQLINDKQGENIGNDVAKLDELEKEKQHFLSAQKDTLSTINFYENTVTNILNKTYGKENVKQITDEYGNTWNEVDLTSQKILDNSIPMFSIKPENTLTYLQQIEFKKALEVGKKYSFIYWSETTSQNVEAKDVIVTSIDDDRFSGNYENGESRIFKLSNIVSDRVPKKYSYEDQANLKSKLEIGKTIRVVVNNVPKEGAITEIGDNSFKIDNEEIVYKDIDIEDYKQVIEDRLNAVAEVLLIQKKAFSRIKTEEGLNRYNAIEKALLQLENYKELGDLVEFLNGLKTSINLSKALLLKLSKEPTSTEDELNKRLYTISFIKKYIDSFEVIKSLSLAISDSPASLELKQASNAINNSLALAKAEYDKVVTPILGKWLYSNFKESINVQLKKLGFDEFTEEKLIQELSNPSTDLDWFNTYLVPLSNSNDLVAGLLASKVKDGRIKANFTVSKDLNEVEKILSKFKNNKTLFAKITKILELKDEDGNITKRLRGIIEKYNYKKFYDEFFSMLKGIKEINMQIAPLVAIPFKERTKEQQDALKSLISTKKSLVIQLENYKKEYAEILTSEKMNAKIDYIRKHKFDEFQETLSKYYTPSSELLATYSYTDLEGVTHFFSYNNNYIKPKLEHEYFITDEYKNMNLTSSEVEFYDTFTKLYNDYNNKLPAHRKFKNGILPSQYEESLTKGWDKQSILNRISNFFKDNTTQYTTAQLDGSPYKEIPIGLMRGVDVSEASDDIISSLVVWMNEVEEFKNRNEIYGAIETIETVLENKPKDETQKKGDFKKVDNNRLNAVSKFIKQVYYGESKASNTPLDKTIDALGKFTALTKMALKPSGAIANAIIGNYQNLTEAFGGRNFNTSNLGKGYAKFFSLMKNDKQKLDNILYSLDAIQGSFKNNLREKFSKNHLTVGDAFALYSYGEYEIQGVACLSLLDAWGITIPENGIFDIDSLPKDFIPTLHELNKSNHGVYAEPVYYSDSAYFRLLLQFRKYVIPTYRARFSGMTQGWKEGNEALKYRLDVESGTLESGYYRSFATYVWTNLKALKDGNTALLNWNNYNDIEREGIKRTILELVSFFTAVIALKLLGADDEEEKNIVEWEIIYQLGRFRGDLAAYLPLIGTEDQLRLVNKPFAAASTLEQFVKFLYKLFTLEEYERAYQDYEEGDYKFRQPLSKLNPFDNILDDMEPEIQYNNFKAASR